MLHEKIKNRESGILTYGMTPPKAAAAPEKIAEIATKQRERIQSVGIDALILYDVQEEAERIELERPFQYLPTIDPAVYSNDYLNELKIPKIIYQCVGKYTETQFVEWVKSEVGRVQFSVYVGASSSKQEINLDLVTASTLSKRINASLTFGGVIIPERHMKKKDEHLRMINKISNGCSFFVSQATYNVEATKNVLSDYYYHCMNIGVEMAPIIINLAPCGSVKTLEFMKWLGISIPTWLENDLKNSKDVVDKSITISRKIFEEILEFGLEKGIPIGCSVESISSRKVEIEASIQLLKDIKSLLNQKLHPAVVTK